VQITEVICRKRNILPPPNYPNHDGTVKHGSFPAPTNKSASSPARGTSFPSLYQDLRVAPFGGTHPEDSDGLRDLGRQSRSTPPPKETRQDRMRSTARISACKRQGGKFSNPRRGWGAEIADLRLKSETSRAQQQSIRDTPAARVKVRRELATELTNRPRNSCGNVIHEAGLARRREIIRKMRLGFPALRFADSRARVKREEASPRIRARARSSSATAFGAEARHDVSRDDDRETWRSRLHAKCHPTRMINPGSPTARAQCKFLNFPY